MEEKEVARRFKDGELLPSSMITDMKHIGPYLGDRLRDTFSPHATTFTIGTFAESISQLSTEQLRERLKSALQNKRARECVDRKHGEYQVRAVNDRGWRACVALIRTLAKGKDGHGMGTNFAFDASRLRVPRARERTTSAP